MKKEIFKKAFYRYQWGEIKKIVETERASRYMVDGIEVRLESTTTGMKVICECEHHMKHQKQDKLCSRMIALIIYVYKQEGHKKK